MRAIGFTNSIEKSLLTVLMSFSIAACEGGGTTGLTGPEPPSPKISCATAQVILNTHRSGDVVVPRLASYDCRSRRAVLIFEARDLSVAGVRLAFVEIVEPRPRARFTLSWPGNYPSNGKAPGFFSVRPEERNPQNIIILNGSMGVSAAQGGVIGRLELTHDETISSGDRIPITIKSTTSALFGSDFAPLPKILFISGHIQLD